MRDLIRDLAHDLRSQRVGPGREKLDCFALNGTV